LARLGRVAFQAIHFSRILEALLAVTNSGLLRFTGAEAGMLASPTRQGLVARSARIRNLKMSTSLNARSLVVMVALVAGFSATFLAGEADARVPAGRFDSVSKGCGDLQDQYDRGVRDLEHASRYGTQAQYDSALESLKSIIRAWNGSLCSKQFGSLLYRTAPVVNGIKGTPKLAQTIRSDKSTSGSTSNPKVTTSRLRNALKKQ
jgi:hypothetical protein